MIDRDDLKPPFTGLWTGENTFLKDRTYQRVRSFADEWEMTSMDVEDTQDCLEDVRSTLMHESVFFSQDELILLRDIDRLPDPGPIESYLDDLSDHKSVCMWTRDRSDHPSWIDQLDVDYRHECEDVSSRDLPNWIQSYVSSHGYHISTSHAKALVGNVGEDLFDVANELDKILIYHDDSEPSITEDDIVSVVYQHADMDRFDIVEAFFEGRSKKALRMMAIHYHHAASDPTIPLVSTFLYQTRQLIYLRSSRDHHRSKSEIRSSMGKPPFIMDKLESQVKDWSLDELNDIHDHLIDIDRRIKRGEEGHPLMEFFVASHLDS